MCKHSVNIVQFGDNVVTYCTDCGMILETAALPVPQLVIPSLPVYPYTPTYPVYCGDLELTTISSGDNEGWLLTQGHYPGLFKLD